MAYAIRLFTWSDFSHVGLVDLEMGRVLDSRLANGGVSTYSIGELLSTYENLVYVDPPCDPAKLWRDCYGELGKPYDWGALFGFVFRRDWQDSDKWFCSEHVAYGLSQQTPKMFAKGLNRVTPGGLFDMLWQSEKTIVKWNGKVHGLEASAAGGE